MSGVAEGPAPETEDPPGASPAAAERYPRQRWSYSSAVIVFVVGLIVTGVLTWVSARDYTRNETRLLKLRARDVSTVLTEALPSLQTPLASAAALADATGGNVAKFRQFVAPYVGTGNGRPFDSVSLWRVGDTERGPVALVGPPPALQSTSNPAPFFVQAARSSTVTVIGMLRSSPLHLGYAFTGMASGPFAAYGESSLPRSRYAPVQNNSAFNDLNYAVYLGASTNPADLLVATVHRLPLTGRLATVRVPFGNTYFTVAVAARGPLGGSLPQRLPWAIAIGGVLLTLGALALTTRLIERRHAAEGLARELEVTAEQNRRLYAEQRGIAQTLQHALLPTELPHVPGVQLGARYQAGEEGVEVGGDWYDVIALHGHRVLLVVGDVSGRGLRAATTMASLRFAIHAYAAEGHLPDSFLSKLSSLLSLTVDHQLATVLCVLADIEAREVRVTNAGHLPPLLIGSGEGEFVEAPVGLPVGVDRDAAYSSARVRVPPGATLLAFTDGLVERRGETIDVGLERLRHVAGSDRVPLDQLLTRVIGELRNGASDDTAIAGIRWEK